MEWSKFGAMLGVFALSLIASTFPTLSKRLTFVDVPHTLFFVLKHFGTGVILSTAFVHLLQDAFKILLGLPEGHVIRHWVGLIVLAALLAIFLIEYLSMAYVEHLEKDCHSKEDEESRHSHHGHHHHHGDAHTMSSETSEVTPKPDANESLLPPLPEDSNSLERYKAALRSGAVEHLSERSTLLRTASSPSSAVPADGHHYSSTCTTSKSGEACPYRNKFEFLRRKLHRHQEDLYTSHGRCETSSSAGLREEEEEEEEGFTHLVHDESLAGRKHAIVNVLVLQGGIMIHSMVIGLTLSIKSGPEFTSLVIAILFHQLFEGLSLGVRLAGLAPSSPSQHDKSKKFSIPIILAIIFACAVPAGCLIGRLTLDHSPKSPNDGSLRLPLAQGLTSALSAGTLIYASGVELLAGDFLHSSLRQASIGRQALALASLLAGAAGMAALAAFD